MEEQPPCNPHQYYSTITTDQGGLESENGTRINVALQMDTDDDDDGDYDQDQDERRWWR